MDKAHPLIGCKVYYIESKNSHKGHEIKLKAMKVRKVHNNLINGSVPVVCCFERATDAITSLENGVKNLKEDLTTQLMDALHYL